MLKIVTVKKPPTADKIQKNIIFGTVRGLTETAKQGQAAVIGALKGTFTIRGRWYEPGNKFGIKIKAATIKDPTAEVRTRADWLAIHEKGGIKTAKGGRLAIPTDEVKRNKRLIIPKEMRPKGLRMKGSFVIKTKHGDMLAIRAGRGKKKNLKFLYNLEERATIKKESTFFDPLNKVVKRRLNTNVRAGIKQALATIK